MILGDGAELMHAAPATRSSKWRCSGEAVKAELFIIFELHLITYGLTLAATHNELWQSQTSRSA